MRSLILIISLFFISGASFANQEFANNPYHVVQNVSDKLFERMKEENVGKETDADVLKQIIREELIPHTDYQFAAFKVLGSNFRSVPNDKLVEYTEVFREYLVANYASVLSAYTNQTVEYKPEVDFQNKRMVTVRGVIKGGVGPDINIAFKVRKNRKSGMWQAYDIVAEGISMVTSKQSQYSPIIRRRGIDVVISEMNRAIETNTLVAMNEEAQSEYP